MAASQLKRWIDGTLHQGISREQLAYYLDEFTFRFTAAPRPAAGCCYTGSSSSARTPIQHP
jgi:transposase-like protein